LGIFAVFENIYFSSIRPKFRLVNLNLVYINLNLAQIELNNKKLYIYLNHFVKFGTWNFPILMEMVFLALHGSRCKCFKCKYK
jgi:hypothetical protein